ncbi:MAG TPA: hypothetical protein VGC77_06920 [Rhodopseudomonas sp.]|uniref:hypothetical protein n=1 Tax=Rhodopseudomonas sp. TaxID=1078 RepID=UPI002ED7D2F8
MTITDPAVRQLKFYLRNLEKQIVEVDQRVARVVMHGKVIKDGVRKQGDDWQVQLELGRDENDKPVESPWVGVANERRGGHGGEIDVGRRGIIDRRSRVVLADVLGERDIAKSETHRHRAIEHARANLGERKQRIGIDFAGRRDHPMGDDLGDGGKRLMLYSRPPPRPARRRT